MQRLIASLFLCLLLLAGIVTTAQASGPVCIQHGPLGDCTVWANGPGKPPHSGGHGHSGSQSDCLLDSLGVSKTVPCTWRGMPFSNSLQCYVSIAKPQPPQSNPVWGGHTDGAVYDCRLPGSFGGIRHRQVWSASALVGPDPGVLAQQAVRRLAIPAPTLGRYPSGKLQDGTPFTVVDAYTWYWTSSSSFRVLTASASAGGVTVQVRVAPEALLFTPGDGSSTVSCAGPGVAWTASDGVWAASPAGCDYRYPHSSIHEPGNVVNATYGIRWAITWTASTGQRGVLPDLTTTAQARFAVAEAESVVIG